MTIRFPIRAARAYLQRNLGNSVRYKLVEVRRGETVGIVRAVEVQHANSGQRTMITGQRVLANGAPASFYVPDHLVTIVPSVRGAAGPTRTLKIDDEVVLHVPVRSYLRFLPGIFQGEGPVSAREVTRTRSTALARWGSGVPEEQYTEIEIDDDPMRRFLFIFQHLQTRLTDRVDQLTELIDPLMCDARFLPWLASWVGFELDGSLPVHQQRELVRRAIRLYRTRGTRRGIEEMVRVLTSAPVRIRERVKARPVVLGKNSIIGGKDVVARYRRAEDHCCFLMEPTSRASTSFFALTLEPRERFKNRFGERAPGVLRRIVHVVSQERPVHVAFTIQFDKRG
ncbi:MAG: phage tail-like protein [Kiritimatiellia bacterium]